MQIMYEIMSATVPTLLIMLKATVLPMLINESKAEKKNEKMIEFIGSWKRGLTCTSVSVALWDQHGEQTCANQLENGTPRSRAKANSCREVVASMVVEQNTMTMITAEHIALAPA